MKKKIEKTKGTTNAEPNQNPTPRMSTQPPPSAEELKKIIAAKKALKTNHPQAGDIARIRALQIKEEKIKGEPVVFSDEWYEFSVFCQKITTGASTVSNWLKNGWLAYSQLGRLRIINRADIDEMMRRFRMPAYYWLEIDAANKEKEEG
jgi:hypothetical protein